MVFFNLPLLKKQMKDFIKGILLVLAVATLAYLVMYAHGVQKQIQDVRKEIQEMKSRVEAHSEHFHQCSFIHRDDIVVGYDSYLQYKPK